MIDELALRIWNNSEFHSENKALQIAYIKNLLLENQEGNVSEEILIRLMRSAVILAASSNSDHKLAAYEIATSAVEFVGDLYKGIPHILFLILNRLGNFPSTIYAQKRFEGLSTYKLPLKISAEVEIRKNNNQIIIGEKKSICRIFNFLYGES